MGKLKMRCNQILAEVTIVSIMCVNVTPIDLYAYGRGTGVDSIT